MTASRPEGAKDRAELKAQALVNEFWSLTYDDNLVQKIATLVRDYAREQVDATLGRFIADRAIERDDLRAQLAASQERERGLLSAIADAHALDPPFNWKWFRRWNEKHAVAIAAALAPSAPKG